MLYLNDMEIGQGSATLIAAIIAALVGLLSLIQNSKSAEESRYLNIISASRIKWIDSFKEIISKYCATLDSIYCGVTEKPSAESLIEQTIKIKLYLNFNGNLDNVLMKLIYKTNDLVIDDIVHNALQNLVHAVWVSNFMKYIELIAQIYLKIEWERIKFESESHIVRRFDCDQLFLSYANDPKVNEKLLQFKKCTNFDAIEEFKSNRSNPNME